MVIDLGTGDGRAVLTRAAARPTDLVLGIDANAASMAESSRRAARRAERGGLPNAMFLVEAAEALPGPLACRADLVTITFPWGSLLRGVLGLDRTVMDGIAGLVAPGGRVEILVSVVPSDGIEGLAELDERACPAIAAAWAEAGLELTSMCRATAEEVAATRSSWARRLGDRPVWRLSLR